LPVYTPSADDKTAGSVTLTLTANGNGSCAAVSSDMILTISELPVATVTATPSEVCISEPITLAGTVNSGASAGNWIIQSGQGAAEASGTLSTTSNNSGSYEAIFTPDGSYFGDVIFEFIALSNSSCDNDTSTKIITIRNLPTVVNQAYTLCEDVAGNGSVSLDLTSYNPDITTENLANVTIDWFTNSSLTNAVGDPTNTSVVNNSTYYARVTLSATNCFDKAQVDFTVDPQIVLDAGSDEEICDGETLDLSTIATPPTQSNADNLTWTSTGDGTFDDANILRPVYTPGPNDLTNSPITLTLTASRAGPCVDVVDQLSLTIKPVAVIDPITDVSLCPTDTQASIPFTADLTGGTFEWSVTNASQIGLASSTGIGDFPSFTAEPNTSGLSIISTVTVEYTLNGCSSISESFDIEVKPTPQIDNVSDIFVCPGSTVNVNFNANTTGELFEWSNTNTAIGVGLSANGTGDISFTAAENLSGAPITSEFTYSATLNDCSSIEKTFTVTLLPQPEVDPIADIEVCSFDNILTSFSSDVSGATFSWTNDNTATGIPSSGSGNININATENLSGSDLVSTISVTASKDGCESAAEIFLVTVKPKPIINTQANLEICAGDLISEIILSDNSSGASTITWTATNASAIGLPAGSGTGNIPSFTANNNNSTSTITSNVTVTSTWDGCVSDQMNFQIRLKPTPIMNSVSNEELCAGDNYSVTFGNSLGATTTYSWVNDNTDIGLAATGSGDNINFTAATNTTGNDIVANIRVTPTNNGCIGPEEVFVITLKPTPVISSISDIELCSEDFISIPFTVDLINPNLNVTITDNSLIDGSISIVDNNIEFTTSINTSGADQTATISLNAEKNGCTNVETFILTLKYRPVVSSVADRASVCPEEIITGQTFSHDVGTGTFNWEITNPDLIGDGSPSSGTGNLPSFEAANNLTGSEIEGYVKYFSIRDACLSEADSFKISIKPAPVITNTDIIFCDDQEANISFSNNTSVTNASGDVVYYWTNSNTSIGVNNPSGTTNDQITASNFFANTVSTTEDNIAIIEVYAEIDGCTGPPTTFEVRVKPLPVITTPDIEFIQTTCSGDTFTFIPEANITATQFSWNLLSNSGEVSGVLPSGTGNISLDLVNSSNTIQTVEYEISTLNGNCAGETKTLTINVYPELNLQPLPAEKVVCSGSSFEIALNTTNNVSVSGEDVIYEWDVSTNNVGATAGSGTELIETLTNNKTNGERDTVFYFIRPTLNNGICVGLRDTVPVIVNPDAVVYAGADTIVCQGASVLLEATIGKGASSGSWSGGAGTYNNRNSLSTFYTPTPSEVGTTIVFTFTSNDPDGSIGPCTAVSDQVNVTIDELPTALITGNPFPTGQYCVRNGRQVLEGNNTNYSSPDVIFSGPGIEYDSTVQRYYFNPELATVGGPYTITYAVTNINGCVNTDEVIVTVTNGLSAGFRVNNALRVGDDYIVCFNQRGIELLQDERNVIGEFSGPGVEFNAQGVPIFNPAKENVTDTSVVSFEILDPSTGCISQSSVNIIRIDKPDFDIEESKVCDINNPYTITIQDFTIYDNAYDSITNVSFSEVDNNANNILNIEGNIITFETPGLKDIFVTWTFELGCSYTEIKQVNVGNIESLDFSINNITVTAPGQPGTIFTVEEQLANITVQEYIWSFGDGSPNETTNAKSIEHNYTEAGSYEIILTAIDEYGCSMSDTNNINIVPAINAENLPYLETFENDNGSWFTFTDVTSEENSSWIYQTGSSSFDTEINSSNYWMTAVNGQAGYTEDERSYLVGPTFDLTSLERPTLSFDMYLDFQDGDRSGAAVEYNLGDGNWILLGGLNDELNWYNDDGTELIGSENNDAGIAWKDNSNANDDINQTPYKWVRVAHTLDGLADFSNITFRIIFASNNYDGESLGMAIDNFYVGERQKLVLFENFTNLNAVNYSSNRTSLESLLTSELGSDLVPLNFHISTPLPDSINLRNSVQLDGRASIYSIQESPELVIDGEIFDIDEFGSQSALLSEFTKKITARALLEPKNLIDITIDDTADEHTIRFDATLKPNTDTTSNLITYFFVIEKSIQQSNELNNIVRKILPNINGVNLNQLSEITNNTYEWPVTSIYSESDLAIVSVVQDRNTNSVVEIHIDDINQAKSENNITTNIENGFESLNFSLYPNPSRGNVHLVFNQELSGDLQIFILDSKGSMVKDTKIKKGTSKAELDLNGFASGVYHIITKNSEGKLNRKKIVILD
jgi:hypothetical protein